MGDEEKQNDVFDDGYTAFRKWEYKRFIYVDKQPKPWISFKESFYRASEVIVENLAKGRGFPDLEGVEAVFLFRHYLELALKTLVMRGRFLERADKNAAIENVKKVSGFMTLRNFGSWCSRKRSLKLTPRTGIHTTPFSSRNVLQSFTNAMKKDLHSASESLNHSMKNIVDRVRSGLGRPGNYSLTF